MSLHDVYARRTPYELIFPDPGVASDLIGRIADEADGRGVDTHDLHAFLTLGSVAAYVQGLHGPDAPPDAIHRYGTLVYHAYHFDRAGRPLHLLSTHVARYLVDGTPPGSPRPPADAGYLQLPRHLFWTEEDEARSIDGLFWSVAPDGTLRVLCATGLRPDRAGLDVVPLPEAPLADAPAWLDVDVRAGGDDFRSTLPGAELDGLYSVRSAGEPLKLLARFFAYVDGVPDALQPGRETEEDDPTPSDLPFSRVTLDA